NHTSRPLVCLCRNACGIRIEMPEYLRFCELSYGIVRQNPAPDFLRSLTHRLARITRSRDTLRDQLCPWEKEQTEKEIEKECAVQSHLSNHRSEPQSHW